MPIYEYDCQRCGTFEATQRITDKPLAKCPTCKSKVRKLISNTSFQLKGTGWYVTDYARKGKSEDGKSDTAKTESSKNEGASKPASECKKRIQERATLHRRAPAIRALRPRALLRLEHHPDFSRIAIFNRRRLPRAPSAFWRNFARCDLKKGLDLKIDFRYS